MTTSYSFQSIEQLDEMMHDMGWTSEYRQLKPGPFSSSCTVLEGDSWFLAEEQSSRRLEVEFMAPEGMVALALVEGEPAVVNGQRLSSEHIYVQGPNPEVRVTFPAGVRITQIGLLADEFEDVLADVAPELSVPRDSARSIRTAPGCLAGLRQVARASLFAPSRRKAVREEATANIVAGMVAVAAEHGKTRSGQNVHRAAASRVLHKAREHIESHLEQTIRIASLCRYTGTNYETLERTFVREVGLTPQQYIQVRRLNSVYRHLLSADKRQGLNVTDLAVRHGFTHMGRFSGAYQHHFGEYPRETLLRQ